MLPLFSNTKKFPSLSGQTCAIGCLKVKDCPFAISAKRRNRKAAFFMSIYEASLAFRRIRQRPDDAPIPRCRCNGCFQKEYRATNGGVQKCKNRDASFFLFPCNSEE